MSLHLPCTTRQRDICAIILLTLVFSAQPALAQGGRQTTTRPPGRGAPTPPPLNPGCYDISYTVRSVETLVGRVSFDQPASVSDAGITGPMGFIGGRTGFGSPRGEWTVAKSDSVFLRTSYIDSGQLFSFPKFVGDTIRGVARGRGMTDSVTVYQARAVRKAC